TCVQTATRATNCSPRSCPRHARPAWKSWASSPCPPSRKRPDRSVTATQQGRQLPALLLQYDTHTDTRRPYSAQRTLPASDLSHTHETLPPRPDRLPRPDSRHRSLV